MVPFCDADHDFDAALIAMAPDLAAEVIRLTQINAELTAANAALMVRVEAAREMLSDCREWNWIDFYDLPSDELIHLPTTCALDASIDTWLAGGAE